MKFPAIVCLAFGLLASCAPSHPPASPAGGDRVIVTEQRPGISERPDTFMSPQQEASWDAIDHQACAAAGGRVEMAGMLGHYRCTIPFADGGAVCRDSSECEGRCMAGPDTDYSPGPSPVQQTGTCAMTDNPFGCYSTIEGGVPTPMLCVD